MKVVPLSAAKWDALTPQQAFVEITAAPVPDYRCATTMPRKFPLPVD